MNIDLTGKTAFVTGGSKDIGKASPKHWRIAVRMSACSPEWFAGQQADDKENGDGSQ